MMLARRAFPPLAGLLAAALAAASPAPAQTSRPPQPLPQAAPQLPRTVQPLSVSAFFVEKGEQIRSGVKWHVFRARNDENGDLPIVGESDDAAPTFSLEPGIYVVHAAYGLAAATRRVEIGNTPAIERLVLNCGALKVEATIGDKPVPAAKLTSRISAMLPTGERRLIAEDVPADDLVRLPEGRYFVESNYGDSNASVSAEISIKAGQLTDATFHHNAATLTLKLVNQPGGEALADTAWSVLTPGGDVIRESIGAFPSMILAEGNYTVVARHDGRVYTREFDVKSGLDQDVEVMAK
ncbi:hypothetical protein [Labrys wisconsinensis]|uniref:Uncharacterized protein n=2 Tax=Pseudomonadota TaxID=1224 RepID=A0ABU0J441_9HYPH|nr:hypothetical protein [Labrys wisconsinensis]MDQ0469046.1 hypothetical protein [Labrys wisconsinensis]